MNINLAPTCGNCNNAVNGRYCSHCGQDQRPLSLTLPGMLGAACREVFDVDGRFIKTTRTMLLHPGRITDDILNNRRAGYLPPFRIYLVASVVLYFCINLLTTNVTFTIDIDLTGDSASSAQDTTAADAGLMNSFNNRLSVLSDSAEFGESVFQHLPEVGFVLLPFLALLLKGLYFRSGRAIGEHLLAAVHMKTGVFIVFIAAAIVSGVGRTAGWMAEGTTGLVTAVALVASAGYIGLSLHTVYGGHVLLTVVRTALVMLIYWIMASIGLVGVAAILVMTSG